MTSQNGEDIHVPTTGVGWEGWMGWRDVMAIL